MSTERGRYSSPNQQERRRRILGAARTQLDSRGLTALTMQSIADTSDVSLKTLYNLFGSRRDAQRYYIGAWNTLEQLGDQEALLEEYFGVPVNLQSGNLPDVYPDNSGTMERVQKNPNRFMSGSVTAEYDIDASGQSLRIPAQ